jgi:uncharacterized protein with von Willebrand factor type A (vWA) domain
VDRILNDFLGLLRRHDVRVSPAEGLDALESLRHVGLSDRATVRDALRTTLVKSAEDVETFDRLFDLYARICDRVEVVRNVAELGVVAEGLVARVPAGSG